MRNLSPEEFRYTPDPEAPEEGEWDRSSDVPAWRQAHHVLVQDAMKSWVGDPASMRIHMSSALSGEGAPSSGSGKKMRAQASALYHEVSHAPEISRTLYRGDSRQPRGVTSWSEDRAVAERWGPVHESPPGTRGVRMRDYIRSGIDEDERQWLAIPPDS